MGFNNQPKKDEDEEPACSHWFDQEALDEAAGRAKASWGRRNFAASTGVNAASSGLVESINFVTFINDWQRGLL